jgi:hypothetical protein
MTRISTICDAPAFLLLSPPFRRVDFEATALNLEVSQAERIAGKALMNDLISLS